MKKSLISIISLFLLTVIIFCSCAVKTNSSQTDEKTTSSSSEASSSSSEEKESSSSSSSSGSTTKKNRISTTTVKSRDMYVQTEPKQDGVVKKAFLCIGQSNMGGRGFLTGNLSGNPDYYNSSTGFDPEIVDPISDSRIYMMNNSSTCAWTQMSEPVFIDPGKYPGASLVASFAKAYVETFDENIGLIAVPNIGGKSLGNWWPDGELYNSAVKMGREALKTCEIIGILWHQGESDANNPNYASNFKSVIDTLCLDLGLDKDKIIIVTGELFQSVPTDPQRVFPAGEGTIVNNALHSLESYYGKYAVVNGKGLRCNPDQVHADGPSLRLLGYRYFAAYYKLATGGTYTFVDDYSYYVEEH